MRNAAIVTTIKKLREEYTQNRFTSECHDFVENTCGLSVSEANDRSWNDCYDFLHKYLPTEEQYQNRHLIFEFVMPESNRRVDVVLITQKKVVVLEFKEKNYVLKNDITQAAGYGRSITFYHYSTQENSMEVSAYLVYTPGDPVGRHDLIGILHPDNFTQIVNSCLVGELPMSEPACMAWIASPFHPLKNIADATLQLFRDGELPSIKSIREGDIKATLDYINCIIDSTEIKKSILFVSGVPGSGKTLVGLKTVYDHGRPGEELNPIYLSGNDPLVNILQNTLSVNHVDREGESFIQRMKRFREIAYDADKVPMNDIIVFDEAQRAWDRDREEPGQTEATLLLRIGDRIAKRYGKVTIICLVGEGQAIHKYEETGMQLWADALAGRADWNVYIPNNYDNLFIHAPNSVIAPELLLDTSIRHDFIDVSPWVEAILDLDLDSARSLYQDMLKKGFDCWPFREKENLFNAVQYIEDKHPGDHTGLVVSSHMKKKAKEYFGKQYRSSRVMADDAYHWYTELGPKLTYGASEFLIQGIELEYPIVAFVGDYYIKDGKWVIDEDAVFDPAIKDKESIIKNVYRVLLTRSRKGMFIYFPMDTKLDETFNWFKKCIKLNGN